MRLQKLIVFLFLFTVSGLFPNHVSGHGKFHDERSKKALYVDFGQDHALLTAYLGKSGFELDIYFETEEKNPKPVALKTMEFTAKFARNGDVKRYEVTFKCAPLGERPKSDRPGTCSHFHAPIPWMKKDDIMYVMVNLKHKGEDLVAYWSKYVPRKFAHYID